MMPLQHVTAFYRLSEGLQTARDKLGEGAGGIRLLFTWQHHVTTSLKQTSLEHAFFIAELVMLKSPCCCWDIRHLQSLVIFGLRRTSISGTRVSYEPSLHYSITSELFPLKESQILPRARRQHFISIQRRGSKAWLVGL